MKKSIWIKKDSITGTIIFYLVPFFVFFLLILLSTRIWAKSVITFSIVSILLFASALVLTAMAVHRLETKILTREKLARLLVENRKDYAIFNLDPKGKIMSWNKSAEKVLGYIANEIIGKSFSILFTQVDQEQHKPEEELAKIQKEKQCEMEGWRVDKKGERFWATVTGAAIFDEQNVLQGYTLLIRNTSRLKDADAKFKILLEAFPDALVITHQNGEIVLANKQTEEMFEYNLRELHGLKIERLFQQKFDQITSVNTNIELSGMKKSGMAFPVELRVNSLETSEGLWLLVAIRDISSRKKAEEELQQLVSNLERSNKELERFAYIASHDLQEPLRMVASFTQLLAKKYKNKIDQEANEYIDFAVDGALRMQNLITDLLAYSRVSTAGKPFLPTDCNQVVKTAIHNLGVAIKESKAEITYDKLPVVQADETQLVQLFQNLLSNAIKFHSAKFPKIQISAKKKSHEWEFCVIDNGIGISPEFHERIFLIFQRLHTKTEYPGTGVGLAICKKIIERHHGKIWVESIIGEGTRFCFTIPT